MDAALAIMEGLMQQIKIIVQRVFALVLWLITVGLGMVDIYFARQIFFSIYGRFSTEGRPAIMWGNIIVVIGAIIFVGFVVMTSEYHIKNVGKHEAWDLFTRTLAVELAIPFIAYFMA